MKRSTVFLGGPIKSGFGASGDFDLALRKTLESCIHCLRESGLNVNSAHEVESFARLSAGNRDGISARDDSWMRECDIYLALLPLSEAGIPFDSIGTGVEIGWALRDRKPVIVLLDIAHSNRYSPFLHDLAKRNQLKILDIGSSLAEPSEFISTIQSSMSPGSRKSCTT